MTSAIACRTATAHPTPSSTAPPLDCLTGRSSHVRWGSRPGHRCHRDRTPDHPRSWRRIRVGATERADVRAVSRVVAQETAGARSAACSPMRYGEAVEAPPSEVRWDRSSGRTVEAPPLLPGAPSLYYDETISVRVARWRRGPARVSSIAGQSAVKPGEQPARPRSRPPGEQRHQAPSRP